MAKPKKTYHILVVDDEPNVGMIFHRVLGDEGYDVSSAATGEECLRAIKRREPDLVFLDIRMPGIDGIETLRRIRETHASLPVIIMTAYKTVTSAMEAMKLGCFDYLMKPLDTNHLKAFVKQALEIGEMFQKTPSAQAAQPAAPREDLVAQSPAMRQVLAHVDKVAPTDLTVLILGESGTGKEVIARAIHQKSPRHKGPFVVVDCAALPESLIESEIFGYEKGAFTGADSAKPGKFETANRGTLFLDEIGNLPLSFQAKLLRFLQDPVVERLGSRKGPMKLNVRIVAATNVDLEKAVEKGTFREDLYHRLKVFLIHLPPLRTRGQDDMDALARHILGNFEKQFGKKKLRLMPQAMALMQQYHWPGNIRELQNALRSAALLSEGEIQPSHLPMSIQTSAEATAGALPAQPSTSLSEVLKDVERKHIIETLKRCDGNMKKAAEFLGIDFVALAQKIKEYEIP